MVSKYNNLLIKIKNKNYNLTYYKKKTNNKNNKMMIWSMH